MLEIGEEFLEDGEGFGHRPGRANLQLYLSTARPEGTDSGTPNFSVWAERPLKACINATKWATSSSESVTGLISIFCR